MKMRHPTIDKLCEKYRNENEHTGRVTSLALLLFDMCRDWLGLAEADRLLLEAGARLHDIGYVLDPPCHPVAGAHIIAREGIDGFDERQTALIGGIVLLHSGTLKDVLASPMIQALRDKPLALRLGAILRIADGLDHGHLQDASIESVQRKERLIELTVRSELWPGNLVAAERKADLWRATFPFDIRILPTPGMTGAAPPLITEDHSAVNAAQRLLLVQYRILGDNVDGVLAGRDPERLHDFRIALRRSRTLLKIFRKNLADTSAEQVRRLLTKLRGTIGPARDMDVWIDLLRHHPGIRKESDDAARWPPFLERQERDRAALRDDVKRCLLGAGWRKFRVQLGQLLRIELPRTADATGRRVPLRSFAAKKFRRALRRVDGLSSLARSDREKDLHRLRIALRKARHLGEFFGPVLDAAHRKKAVRIRSVERELARVHDLDLACKHLGASRARPPEGLRKHLGRRREKQLKRFRRAWKHAMPSAP